MDVATMMGAFNSYGFESDDEMTDDFKIDALNETYWDAAQREDWPFLQKTVTLVFDGTSGVATNLPDDIGGVMYVVRADGRPLQPWRVDDFYQEFGDQLTLTQSPLLYFFDGNELNVYPVPSSSDTALMRYSRVPAELTELSAESDIIFPKRYHRGILVMGTLARLAVAQDDVDMGNAYERLYEKALAYAVDTEMRQQSDRTEFIHVNDPDNWDYS